MKDMNWKNKEKQDFLNAILSLQDKNEAQRFLRDLMTESEIEEFSKRWKAARMLNEGIPYSEIVSKTGLSSTTVARVSEWLNRGMGGYKNMLTKFDSTKLTTGHHHNPTKLGKGLSLSA